MKRAAHAGSLAMPLLTCTRRCGTPHAIWAAAAWASQGALWHWLRCLARPRACNDERLSGLLAGLQLMHGSSREETAVAASASVWEAANSERLAEMERQVRYGQRGGRCMHACVGRARLRA